MKYRISIYCLLSATIFFNIHILNAGEVDSLTILKVAETYYKHYAANQKTRMNGDIDLSLTYTEVIDSTNLYYVFDDSKSNGFIIISADDRTIPVLGYSLESSFEHLKNAPPALQEWLKMKSKEISALKKNPLIRNLSRNVQWNQSLEPKKTIHKTLKTHVSPLLSSKWNQGCGYNGYCPADPSGQCGHVYAGCVATSMAQVMKYHNYPPNGTGSSSWTSGKYGEISADFGATTYNWSGMPVPNGANDDDVEQLLFHCGVAVKMNYSPTGSGSYVTSATNALIDHFGYSSNAVYTCKSGYEDSTWANLMVKECNAGRPVIYKGTGSGGHAFNIDGYQGTEYFHINWGWGGSYNGYFYLDDLTPGSSDFTNSQCATIGIEPSASFPGLDCSGSIPLNCGISYSGTTSGATNIVNRYGNCYFDATGPEVVHSFTTSMPGRISVVVNSEANLGIFLLDDCNKDSLLAYSNKSLIYDNSLPGNYYLVLDGIHSEEGDYSVMVNCPNTDPDLIFLSSNINPYYVESSQEGIRADCEIKNIGNSTAGENKVKFYFSSDQELDSNDILIDSAICPVSNPGQAHFITTYLTMPGSLAPGENYIIFEVDADSVINESDESLNTSSRYVQVPSAGTIDCSSAVPLSSGIRYFGNTTTFGAANIDNYSCSNIMAGKEVIHSLPANYSGLAEIEFSERINGELLLLVLPACNENICLWNIGIWGMTDTLIKDKIPVVGGSEYYFITDGKAGVSGDYSLKVTMPDSCPEVDIYHWGELNRCIGSGSPNLYTDWGMSKYQWYRNGIKVDEAVSENYSPTEDGEYWVEVTENKCTVASDHLTVIYSPEPDTASISALGDTNFCHDNSVILDLYTLSGYTINWAKNDEPIPGATSATYTATESGIYTARVTNISCTKSSNAIEVNVYPAIVEPGDTLPLADTGLISYFEFNSSSLDLSGNNNYNHMVNGVQLVSNRHDELFEAYSFDGANDYVFTTKRFTDPDEFTLSIWFKTSTSKGGRLAGFGDKNYFKSTLSDRQIYMSDDGRVHFGVDNGSPQTISSTESYNDNLWHHAAVCLSTLGIKLYIDGELISSDPSITNGGDYNGFWKFAHDTILSGYTDIPTSSFFEGLLDEIKIFNWELLPIQIKTLYTDQLFKVSMDLNEICGGPGNAKFVLENSQPGIEYQLRNNDDNSLIGSAVEGSGETIYLPTGSIPATTTFNILASQISTGCENKLDSLFTFKVNAIPDVNLGSDITDCDSATLADLSGNTYSIYSWSTGESSKEIEVTKNGNYSLLITDLNGCTNSDTILATIHDSPEATINTTDSDCDSANGTATIITTGGTGTYTYSWHSDITNFSGAKAIEIPSGKYQVSINDGNCLVTKPFSILSNEAPDISVTVDRDSICFGDTSTIQLSGADNYAWSPVEGTTTLNSNKFLTTPYSTTSYIITGSHGNCADKDTITIFVKENPILNLGADTLICGTHYLINAGEGFDSYLWSDGTTRQTLLTDTSNTGYGTKIFYITAFSDGCKSADTIKISYDECLSTFNSPSEDICWFYPNPSNGIVTFEFSKKLSTPVQLIISDLQGRTLKDIDISEPTGIKKTVDLGVFPNEIFIIYIVTKDKTYNRKIIVY
jgi:hypothetical protein